MNQIVVVGGVNMDLHLFDVHAAPGQEPLVADHYLAEPGGKGSNVARAITRLDAEVRLVARVGDDEFGHDCVQAIAADGVDTTGVIITPGTPTGFVAIQLDGGKHRSLLFAPGANDALTWVDIQPHVAGLDEGDIVVAQAEVPADTLAELASHTVAAGASLFLDPTPPDRVNTDVISRAEVITPNRMEAAALVGRLDTSPLWPVLAARELLEAGARRALVKVGAAGAILADGGQMLAIPTIPVDAVDETGAGDVFLATLAVGRAQGLDWPEATTLANVASALSLAEQGLFLPDRANVDEAAARAGGPSPVSLP
ncbi:MAG: PfkB family carbohydrate kinase [Acidimicrobiia bacterium]|jgi:ribokinase